MIDTARLLRFPMAALSALVVAAVFSACSGSGAHKPLSQKATGTTTASTTTSTAAPTSTSSTVTPPTTAATAATTSTTGAPAPPGTAPANSSSSVDTSIRVYGDCTTTSVEPAGIVLACADYGESVSGLSWSSWTASGASGVGMLIYNDCNPNCAAGHQHSVPGTRVSLSDPVAGAGGQEVWSKITLSPAPPGGIPATGSLPVRPV